RKEGPVNYRMSGEYIVIAPIPANLVLRYGSKYALLWPSHAIRRVAPAPTEQAAERVALVPPPPQQATITAPAPQPAVPSPPVRATGGVKVADVTSLYSDKLTDAHNTR